MASAFLGDNGGFLGLGDVALDLGKLPSWLRGVSLYDIPSKVEQELNKLLPTLLIFTKQGSTIGMQGLHNCPPSIH
jgi:hypothetical protein